MNISPRWAGEMRLACNHARDSAAASVAGVMLCKKSSVSRISPAHPSAR